MRSSGRSSAPAAHPFQQPTDGSIHSGSSRPEIWPGPVVIACRITGAESPDCPARWQRLADIGRGYGPKPGASRGREAEIGRRLAVLVKARDGHRSGPHAGDDRAGLDDAIDPLRPSRRDHYRCPGRVYRGAADHRLKKVSFAVVPISCLSSLETRPMPGTGSGCGPPSHA